jgi:hypothetical protein
MDDSLYTGFVRRRRYLIAISVSVALVKYLGLTLPEIDVLGNKAIVHHPERVIQLGYVLWLIAFWVYVQWFNDYGAWLKSVAAYNETRQELLLRAMKTDNPAPSDLVERLRRETPAQGVLYKVTPANVFLDPDRGDRVYYQVQGWQRLEPTGLQSVGGSAHFERDIPRGVLWSRNCLALLIVVTAKRYFSEFYAPFLVALLPLVSLLER